MAMSVSSQPSCEASLREKRKRNIGYMNLCQYLFFCLFYMLVVYIQSDALNAFNVLSSVPRRGSANGH